MRRMRIIFIVGLIFLPFFCSAQEQNILMFWNIENYFDPFDDPNTKDDDFTSQGLKRWYWSRFLQKRNYIAKLIFQVEDKYGALPDIIGLAEVENRFVLNKLIYETALARCDYSIIHKDSKDRRGIDLALLYRKSSFNVLQSKFIEVPLPKGKTTRDILYVRGVLMNSAGAAREDTLNIFVLHFPSKFGGAKVSEPFRKAAASTLYSQLDSLKGQKFICMGDFNDSPNSEIFHQIPSAAKLMFSKEYAKGTIKYRGVWETIDNFITSQNLKVKAEIFQSPLLLENDETYLGLKPFRTYIGPKYNGGISDHLPIIAIIK